MGNTQLGVALHFIASQMTAANGFVPPVFLHFPGSAVLWTVTTSDSGTVAGKGGLGSCLKKTSECIIFIIWENLGMFTKEHIFFYLNMKFHDDTVCV